MGSRSTSSLAALLKRQLAEVDDEIRFVDQSAVVRRLLVSEPLPRGVRLYDETGGVWIVGDEAEDGKTPVSSEVVGYSRRWPAGTRLTTEDGRAVELRAVELMRAGGVWDNLRQQWKCDESGERERGTGLLVVDAQESQLDAFAWLRERIGALAARQLHPQSTGLLFDDRRGGKTFVGVMAVVLAALECPRIDGSPLEGRIVTQTIGARDEIDEVFAFLQLDRLGWAKFREQPKRMWIFVTGAKIRFLTTDNEDTALEGRQDVVFLNEAAIFKRSIFETVVRATRDRRGFAILATNKPKKPRGNWVALMWMGAEEDEAAGNVPAVRRLRVDPSKNAAVAQEAIGPIARAILYARGGEDQDIDEGLIAEAGHKLFAPPWSDVEHVRELPDLGYDDVTGLFTRFAFGRAFSYIVGHDYQWACAASAWRLLAPGGDLSKVEMWCTWARWLREGGDEKELLDEMEADGYTNDRVLVIPDCSGGSQGSRHQHGKEPPSFEVLRSRRFAYQEPVQKMGADTLHGANPRVPISIMRCRTWIASGRVFVAKGDEAAKMARAFARCDAYTDKYGDLRSKGPWAHLIDTFRYPQWWVMRWLAELQKSQTGRARVLTVRLPGR